MILLFCNNGQLCNKLWSITPISAYASENNIKLIIFFFDEYSSLFPNLKGHKHIKVCHLFSFLSKRNSLLKRLYVYLSRVIPDRIETLGLFSPVDLSVVGTKKLVLLNGWSCRFLNILKAHDFAQKYFSMDSADDSVLIDSYKTSAPENTVIVGVHMRRGDYRTYCNGKYHYTNSEYTDMMRRIMEENPDFSIAFILCSDEPVPYSAFPVSCKIVERTEFSPTTDLKVLSLCDYIIGPPSTFSQWASFTGNVPLRIIEDLSVNLNFESFKIIECMDTFKS
jgi:hypothetical protein